MMTDEATLDESRHTFRRVIRKAQAVLGQLDEPSIEAASPPTDPWPTMHDKAFHGLVGQIVRTIEPHTEADPVALLASLLSEIGTMLTRGPHLVLDGSVHPLLLWIVLIGNSSKSRKGTAGKRCRTVCAQADPEWTRGECKGTLSSGEGLAYAVRDARFEEKPVKEKGAFTGETVTVCVDGGVADKRLFLEQSEFGAMLRVMHREGNSLSGVLRDAWDGQDLAPMTKANRVKATAPHIGIVGHVTKDELLRNFDDVEASNGFGNRYTWLVVRRSKELPFSSDPDPAILGLLTTELGNRIRQGRTVGRIELSPNAKIYWAKLYHDLSGDRPGLAGSLLARGEAQVMRLAAIYALLDGDRQIELAHLEAALAVWDYAEASTRLTFGDKLGDPVADAILAALREQTELSETELSALFGRNITASRLDQAKKRLVVERLAHSLQVETDGRPRTVWRLGTKETKETNEAPLNS